MPTGGGRLAVVIHDLNQWAGMERCTLEVFRRLSHRWPVSVHAYTLEDPDLDTAWGDVRFRRVRPAIRRPEILKTLWFYAATTLPLMRRSGGGAGRRIVHASGACALVSDVVQVHFVHAAWRSRRSAIERAAAGGAGDRPRTRMTSRLRAAYHRGVTAFNAATERITFGRHKTYVAVSRGVARELERHYGLRGQVHVIHHGVDPARFHPEVDPAERTRARDAMGVGAGETVALLVGAYDRKGLACAVEAMARLAPHERAALRLAAAGGGDRARYSRLARERGVEDRVLLLPHTKEIGRIYRAADLFVFPTLYEPFGLVILEAMASGLPPIVSRQAGAAELIEHGVSGLLLEDPLDPDELAACLRRLATDRPARERMGRAALAVAAARSWDRVAEEYAAVLAPLMDRGRT